MKETNTYKRLKGKKNNNTPEYLIVHHFGGSDKYPLMDTSNQTAKIVEQWHLSKGWDGIGYHFIIHKDGEVWRGRPENYNGAHTIGKNFNSLGIALAGNFDLTLPTKAQIASLRVLLKDMYNKYDIKDIVPHRKFANKSCYGKNLNNNWAKNLMNKNIEEDCLLSKHTTKELIVEILKRFNITI